MVLEMRRALEDLKKGDDRDTENYMMQHMKRYTAESLLILQDEKQAESHGRSFMLRS